MRSLVIPVLIGLVMSLAFGGLIHGAVKHSHGEGKGKSESALWAELHSSLRHEDKKMLFMSIETLVLLVVATISLALRAAPSLIMQSERAMTRDPTARLSLRRGISDHRKFR